MARTSPARSQRVAHSSGSERTESGSALLRGDETGEPGPTRGLAGGVVAQVEAPPDVVAAVGQGAVHGQFVHEQNVTGLEGHGYSIPAETLFQDVHVLHARFGRAVRHQPSPVASRHYHHAAVLLRGLYDREPDSENVRFIGIGDYDALVLVPCSVPDGRVAKHVFR